jgi:hypothetical protein
MGAIDFEQMVKDLSRGGRFTQEEAEDVAFAVSNALRDGVTKEDLDTLATKTDVTDVATKEYVGLIVSNSASKLREFMYRSQIGLFVALVGAVFTIVKYIHPS